LLNIRYFGRQLRNRKDILTYKQDAVIARTNVGRSQTPSLYGNKAILVVFILFCVDGNFTAERGEMR
jgi:hypothetical protein